MPGRRQRDEEAGVETLGARQRRDPVAQVVQVLRRQTPAAPAQQVAEAQPAGVQRLALGTQRIGRRGVQRAHQRQRNADLVQQPQFVCAAGAFEQRDFGAHWWRQFVGLLRVDGQLRKAGAGFFKPGYQSRQHVARGLLGLPPLSRQRRRHPEPPRERAVECSQLHVDLVQALHGGGQHLGHLRLEQPGQVLRQRHGTLALAQTDLAIPQGDFVALVGPSGCGKSTILKLVANLLQPSSGGVVVRGRATLALNRTATFVFHLGPRYFGSLTAYVVGPDAAKYRFTSGLPVQILSSMAPILLPYLDTSTGNACPPAPP